MASTLDRPLDIKHYLRLLWRRKWLVLLAAVVAVCAALTGLTMVPKQYRSAATLSIEERVPLSSRLEEVLGNGRTQRSYRYEEERLARIASDVRSRAFLERVVKVLKMNEDPRILEVARARQKNHPELTVEQIANRILVESLQARIQVRAYRPGQYEFAVMDYNPSTAQLLAQWISELFIDQTTKKEIDRIRAARNFSTEQLRIYEDQLNRSELALQRYRESVIGNVLDSNPVNGTNLLSAEELYRQLLDRETTARSRVGARARAAIDAGLPAEDPTIREEQAIQAGVRELSRSMHALSVARLTSSGTDPALPNLSSEVANARTGLYRSLETRCQELYSGTGNGDWSKMADYLFAQLDAQAHAEAASSLKLLINEYKRQVQAAPGREREETRLAAEVEKDRQVLESFRSQMVASELQQAVETTDLGLRVEIVDRAQLPLSAAWPDRRKVLVLAFMMGILLGVGFAFLAEVLDPTLRTLDDIHRIAPEPVLGTLPLLEAVIPTRTGLRRRWIPLTLVGVVALTVVYFVARDRILPDVGVPQEAVQAIEPVEGAPR